MPISVTRGAKLAILGFQHFENSVAGPKLASRPLVTIHGVSYRRAGSAGLIFSEQTKCLGFGLFFVFY
jgi:hypothetical protein